MNIFIALAIPKEASISIQGAMQAYTDILGAKTPQERWHCTMLFLGNCEIPNETYENLLKPLRQKFHPTATVLSLGEHEPTHKLWAYMQRGPAITHLREAIIERIRSCNIAIPEQEIEREFTPHITLGTIARKEEGMRIPDMPVKTLFSPKELHVLRSNPDFQDTPYEELGIIPLTP